MLQKIEHGLQNMNYCSFGCSIWHLPTLYLEKKKKMSLEKILDHEPRTLHFEIHGSTISTALANTTADQPVAFVAH